MEVLQLGILAALLQVGGYAFYGSKVLIRDIRPNATSWLMFAYGTTLLLVVEWDRDASLALLALPASCAISSIVVALYAYRQTKRWVADHALDRFSFVFDIGLTIAYVTTWLLLGSNIIGESQKSFAEILILICWNIGIFTAFFPLLRQVYNHPSTEHALPWAIWTGAYLILAAATYVEVGAFDVLMLYPLVNACVHGFIAFHTAQWRYRRKLSLV